jgi:protein TonB
MADVLIVCVREDEPKAKALAEMFEAAGFSIGGAPSSDAALRSSGAGLVVWSQASIRSRPFLDASQRVINAEKAVVASLIEPPPPSSIGDSPVFDLSRWNGDPNDPALDPLFFAVDRMVNAARAQVSAAPVRAYEPPAPSYEPPPAPRYEPPPQPAYDPPPRRAERPAPPPPPAPQPTFVRPSAGDPLGTEAEHWRAIRDSRNPSDFMDYLARYGPEGAFAEVAELRLKQLTQASEPRAAAPAPRPAPPPAPAPRPAVSRPTLPPRNEERAVEPMPPTRRPEPAPVRRAPPPERSYDRAELREPPRSEGGRARALILVALLGGAALLGGLYFGGGMSDFGTQAPQEQVEDISPAPDPTSTEFAEALDEPVGVPIDSNSATPPPERRAERREVEPAPRREPERTVARNEEPEAPTPAPRTSWTGSGGPVSLSPGSGGTQVASNTTNPSTSNPALSTAPPTPVSIPTSTTARTTPTPPRGSVVWAQRPSARRLADLYPSRALQAGVGGRAELDCSVRGDTTVACTVANESPAGMGFGRAALSAANSYRARGTLSDGASATGARTRIVVQFQAPE